MDRRNQRETERDPSHIYGTKIPYMYMHARVHTFRRLFALWFPHRKAACARCLLSPNSGKVESTDVAETPVSRRVYINEAIIDTSSRARESSRQIFARGGGTTAKTTQERERILHGWRVRGVQECRAAVRRGYGSARISRRGWIADNRGYIEGYWMDIPKDALKRPTFIASACNRAAIDTAGGPGPGRGRLSRRLIFLPLRAKCTKAFKRCSPPMARPPWHRLPVNGVPDITSTDKDRRSV